MIIETAGVFQRPWREVNFSIRGYPKTLLPRWYAIQYNLVKGGNQRLGILLRGHQGTGASTIIRVARLVPRHGVSIVCKSINRVCSRAEVPLRCHILLEGENAHTDQLFFALIGPP
jgi:hypothetical protein